MARLNLFSCTSPRLTVVKWAIIIFNALFWVTCSVALGLGISLYVGAEYATFTEGQSLLGVSLFVAAGLGGLVIGFVGIIGTVWENRLLTALFAFMVFLMASTFFTAGVWSVQWNTTIEHRIRKELNKTAHLYQEFTAYQHIWDQLQIQFNCCGIDGWRDWTEVFHDSSTVAPDSCCIPNYYYVDCGHSAVPIGKFYKEGCLSVVLHLETRLHNVIGPLGIIFGVIQLPGIVLCGILYYLLTHTKKSYSTESIHEEAVL